VPSASLENGFKNSVGERIRSPTYQQMPNTTKAKKGGCAGDISNVARVQIHPGHFEEAIKV
jgi:hypothetical protein